ALVFTMREFVPPLLGRHRTEIIAPAIDPLSPKNLPLPEELADRLIRWAGVDPVAAARQPDLSLRPVEGPARRDRRLRGRARAGARDAARPARADGARRPAGLGDVPRDPRAGGVRSRRPRAHELHGDRQPR